ncbi:MAG TPA: response regulator [Tenuifilaceae bacterium]|jgi:DNA-binding NarL/FixJ family response regulator|nr:response regulator [Tenuifilaceae bacterium]HQB77635.1 response regulator [Tenuifilaceae bacterium]
MRRLKAEIYVFLVDQSPEYLSSLKKSIEHPERYIISTYTSGERFIKDLTSMKFAPNDICVAFLGYQFFGDMDHALMNGIEILESIKVINPSIEVIMLTGNDEGSYGAFARKSGAFTVIPKNDNVFMRSNNLIMKVISEKRLAQSKRTFLILLKIFLAYLLLLIIALGIYKLFFV